MKRNLYLQKQNSIHLSLLRFIVFKHEFTEAIKQAHAKYSYLKFFAMYKTDVKTFCTDISDKQTFTCTIRLELCRLPYKVRKSKQQIPMLLRINFFSPKTKTNFKSCTN